MKIANEYVYNTKLLLKTCFPKECHNFNFVNYTKVQEIERHKLFFSGKVNNSFWRLAGHYIFEPENYYNIKLQHDYNTYWNSEIF